MCTDETTTYEAPDDSDRGTYEAPDEAAGGTDLHLGPLSALAVVNDDAGLSLLQCTANDVRVVGPGVILNEPCDCPTGKFDAQVRFTVENNAASPRYCV